MFGNYVNLKLSHCSSRCCCWSCSSHCCCYFPSSSYLDRCCKSIFGSHVCNPNHCSSIDHNTYCCCYLLDLRIVEEWKKSFGNFLIDFRFNFRIF